jgi:hypothetical protein
LTKEEAGGSYSEAIIILSAFISAMAAEIWPGEKTSSWPMTDDDEARVSYVNWVDDPDRHIFMHGKWLPFLSRDLGARTDAAAKLFPRRGGSMAKLYPLPSNASMRDAKLPRFS